MTPPLEGDERDAALHAVRAANRRMARAETASAVADAFVDAAVETLGVDLVAVRRYDPRRDALAVLAAPDVARPSLDGWDDHTRGDETSHAWRVFDAGEPVAAADPSAGTDAEAVPHALYLPLGSHGVAALATQRSAGFHRRERYLAEALAADCAAALDGVVVRRGLRSLHEATRAMQREDDPAAIAAVAVDATEAVLGVPYSGVRFADDGELDVVAVSDAVAEDVSATGTEEGRRLAEAAIERGEPAVFEEVDDGETRASAPPFGAAAVYPLAAHGALTVALPVGLEFDDRRRELANVLAENLTAALDRADRSVRLREQASTIARQDERLEEFASVVSHDLRNPLNVAQGRVDLGRERAASEAVEEELAAARAALDRIEEIVADARALAQGGTVEAVESVPLAAAAREAWAGVETGDATLTVTAERAVHADPGPLASLLENVYRNAVDHAGTAPEVLVEDLREGEGVGFAVEDDGVGVPEDERGAVFRVGHSGGDGTGIGLGVVARVAEAHGWGVRVVDGVALGGARFVVETGCDGDGDDTAEADNAETDAPTGTEPDEVADEVDAPDADAAKDKR